MNNIPVITIDGAGGTGKGTISRLLAAHLGWHLLDSGALYRLLAFSVRQKKIPVTDEKAIVSVAVSMRIQFSSDQGLTRVSLEGNDVTEAIRTEEIGQLASQISIFSSIRSALLSAQRACRQPPGLVADGRDMGTVIFPDARVKIFLTASLEERAKRRQDQLKQQGIDATLSDLMKELHIRDERDSTRSVSPLVQAADAICIDTEGKNINAVFEAVLKAVAACGNM